MSRFTWPPPNRAVALDALRDAGLLVSLDLATEEDPHRLLWLETVAQRVAVAIALLEEMP